MAAFTFSHPLLRHVIPDVYDASTSITQFAPHGAQELAGRQTIMSVVRAAGAGEGGSFGYVFAHAAGSASSGIRFFVAHNGGAPKWQFGADSGPGSLFPAASSNASAVTYGAVSTGFAQYDGDILGSGIQFWTGVDRSALVASTNNDGNAGAAIAQPTGQPISIGNRGNTDRTFNGGIFWTVRWARYLTDQEREDAYFVSPLVVPRGLIFAYANRRDWGPYNLQAHTRTNVLLGLPSAYCPPIYIRSRVQVVVGTAANIVTTSCSGRLIARGSVSATHEAAGVSASGRLVSRGACSSTKIVAIAAAGRIVPRGAMPISIDSTSAQTSVKPTSYVDGDQVYLLPRLTSYEGSAVGWGQPATRLLGVKGRRPTINILKADVGSYWPWQTTENGYFSYDGIAWAEMGTTVSIGSTYITCRHSSPFTESEVWFARSRREGVPQMRDWIDNTLKTAPYSTYVQELAGSTDFVLDTFADQTDELGRNCPGLPLFGFAIRSGSAGKHAVILTGGVHAAEDWSTTIFREAVEWLCGSAIEAVALRAAFDFICLPLVNPMGRDYGHQRAQFTTTNGTHNDVNRHFEDSTFLFDAVTKPRAVLLAETTDLKVPIALDLHMQADLTTTPINYFSPNTELTNRFIAKVVARAGASGFDSGNLPNSCVSSWAQNARHAKLYNIMEYWVGASSDAQAATSAQVTLLALYDLMVEQAFFVNVAGRTTIRGGCSTTPIKAVTVSGSAVARGSSAVETLRTSASASRIVARGSSTGTTIRNSAAAGRVRARGSCSAYNAGAGIVVSSAAGRLHCRGSTSVTPIRTVSAAGRAVVRGATATAPTKAAAAQGRLLARGLAAVATLRQTTVGGRLTPRGSVSAAPPPSFDYLDPRYVVKHRKSTGRTVRNDR